jgi:hypothetical protein
LSDDLRAYVAVDCKDNVLFLKSVKKVPAGTGLLLYGNAGQYDIPLADSLLDVNIPSNMLVGVSQSTKIYNTDDKKCYVFVNNTENPYFSLVSDTVYVEGGGAYLSIPEGLFTGSKNISMILDGKATSIGTVSAFEGIKEDDVYYSLTGVKTSNPVKGIYIYKGRKILVK